MKQVFIEELINYKILPYNIYSEFGEKFFAAGEVLTPGKLLQLRHVSVLYRDEQVQTADNLPAESEKPVKKVTDEPVVEVFDMKPLTIVKKNKLSIDDIDIKSYKGPVNKKAKIDPQTQLRIKAFYNKTLEMMDNKSPLEMLGMFANIRDKIMQDIIFEEVVLSSQLKLLGEYKRCHSLNTAILSGFVAKRMGLPEPAIYDIVLAGLLHDIGKLRISSEILNKHTLTNQEQKIIQNHTKIGYKMIKNEMELSENIAMVALDHHENNDGSGYPNRKSGDLINVETQIVNVCNYFDDLTSNRTLYKIKNTKDALKVMLSHGTQKFAANALYTFVHMFSYNDTVHFEQMIL